jgi:MarR family transcriptional regulator, organic hydroperoxide resistance regulator
MTIPTRYSSASESPGFLLWRVSTLWRRAIEAVLKPLDLTHPQFVILTTTAYLTRSHQKVTQAQIAEQAALDPNTTSQILRSLEAKGLIQRPRLDRSRYPTLTPAGLKLLASALPAVEAADATYFAAINLQRTTLLKGLQTLAHLEAACSG